MPATVTSAMTPPCSVTADPSLPRIQLRRAAEIQHRFRTESQVKAQRAFNSTPILVYSMGKDGSSTVCETLERAGHADRVFHLHTLDATRITNWRAKLERVNGHVPRLLHEAEVVLDQMRKHPHQRIKVISLVRDPLAREVSSLFQNLDRPCHRHILNSDETISRHKAISHLIATVSVSSPCEAFFHWFETEPQRVFGIDILATPFPKDRGWNIYRAGSVEFLLIRLKDLSRVGSEVLSEFLDAPAPIPIQTTHTQMNPAYSSVKRSWKVPLATSQLIYNSRLIRHLYTERERAAMIHNWSLSDETPAESDLRIRKALLHEVAARREWIEKETARLKADGAAKTAIMAERDLEIEQLRDEIVQLEHRFDIVHQLRKRKARLLNTLRELRGIARRAA